MLQQAFSLLFPILSFIFFFFSVSTANSNVYVKCSQLNHTSMTPYELNVNSLFTSLLDSSSIYNFNKYETSTQSNDVYGLFQCRGDLSSTNCKNCVASAIGQLKTACPTSSGGEIQLEGCFVKYDNTSFFGFLDKVEVCKSCGPSIGYNSDVLNRIEEALAHLTGGNGEYFREGDFGSIKGMAQCVQDLSLGDCQDCLSEASRRLRTECETSTWGDMYLGKCYIRYAEQGNVNLASNGYNPISDESNGGGIRVVEITALCITILSILLTIVGVWFAYKKAKAAKSKAKSADSNARSAMSTANSASKTAKEAQEKAAKLEKKLDSILEMLSCKTYNPPCMPMPTPCSYPSC